MYINTTVLSIFLPVCGKHQEETWETRINRTQNCSQKSIIIIIKECTSRTIRTNRKNRTRKTNTLLYSIEQKTKKKYYRKNEHI